MRIRPATPDDIPAMMEMAGESATASQWSAATYHRLFANADYIVLVAEKDGVTGFLVARRVGPECELENMAVETRWRRHGVGRALLANLELRAAGGGCGAVFLEVRESNSAARKFYAESGFLETGRRRNYYANPVEDAILYRKSVMRQP